jgi:hypothetical protein
MAASVADRVMASGQAVTTTITPAAAGKESLNYDRRRVSENAPLQNRFSERFVKGRASI